jgi:tetratricopeptide (TPR) repeat protein
MLRSLRGASRRSKVIVAGVLAAAATLGLVAARHGAHSASAWFASTSIDATANTETSATAGPMAETPSEPVYTGPKKMALAKPAGTAPVDKLIGEAEKAAIHNPQKVDGWIVLGRAWVRKARETADPGFYLNADACAEVALGLSPDDKLALDLQGLVLLNQHKFEEARALAERVTQKNADDAMAWGNLSDALLELGRYDDATAAAQKMMDLKPNLPSYSRASYLAWVRGDDKGAKEAARLAIDSSNDTRDPEPRAWALVQAAQIFWNEGDVDGAEAGFDKTLAWMADYPPALVGKGRVALARGDGKKAAEALAKAYQASPLLETAWLLADAREMEGDAKGAAEITARAEREGRASDPRTLALMYATKNRNPKEALAMSGRELTVRGDVTTHDAHAWSLYRNGMYAEAKKEIDIARKPGTKDARLLYHDGAIRIALGDKAGGKKLVSEALELNPKFDVTGAAEATKLVGGDGGHATGYARPARGS